jgi:electron transfer flavoprotein beta subunit
VNTVVCVKLIPDPEAPADSFKIDASAKKVIPSPNVNLVISPFDEQAVEAALRIKDSQGGKVTIISLGMDLPREIVKNPLAMGADDLIILEDPAFGGGDSWSTAYALAMAIKKVGAFGLIFCGRQAGDWDAGQVGSGIAEILGIPSVTVAKKIEVTDGVVTVERVLPDGYEVIEATLPALVTVSNELGEPRFAGLKGIMAAAKKQPLVWKPADIGADMSRIGEVGRLTRLIKLLRPVKEGACELIEGENLAEAGEKLALRLREAKVI